MNSRVKVLLGTVFFVVAMVAGFSIYGVMNKVPLKEIKVVPVSNAAAISPIFKGTVVEQSFVSDLSSLSKVSFYCATYLKSNLPGGGTFQLLDGNHKILVSQVFRLSDLKDNTFFSFKFRSVDISPSKIYFLTLTSDVKAPDSPFTIWSNQGFQNASFVLRENGKTLRGSAIFNLAGN